MASVVARAAAVGGAAGARLRVGNTALFVCDIQTRFRDVIHEMESVIEAAGFMINVAKEMDLPCVVTEQYPERLGSTVPDLNVAEIGLRVFPKTSFSMLGCLSEKDLPPAGSSVLVCGIESHVCVLQTCLDLKDGGYHPFIVVDAISSQMPGDRLTSIERMVQAGVRVTTAESAAFELLENSAHPSFRRVSALVKERAKDKNAFLKSGL